MIWDTDDGADEGDGVAPAAQTTINRDGNASKGNNAPPTRITPSKTLEADITGRDTDGDDTNKGAVIPLAARITKDRDVMDDGLHEGVGAALFARIRTLEDGDMTDDALPDCQCSPFCVDSNKRRQKQQATVV